MNLTDLAKAVAQLPAQHYRNVSYENGKPLERPKTTASLIHEPAAYLEQMARLFANTPHAAAVRELADAELTHWDAKKPILYSALGDEGRRLVDRINKMCESYGARPPFAGAITLADVAALYADLKTRQHDAFDGPVAGDVVFSTFLLNRKLDYAVFDEKQAGGLAKDALALYRVVERDHVQRSAALGEVLARANREANPKITDIFFKLLDRFR